MSSRLLLRNRDFIYESDAITFFLKYLHFDDNSLKHKLEADLNKQFLDEVDKQHSRMLKTAEMYEEYKKQSAEQLGKEIKEEEYQNLNYIKYSPFFDNSRNRQNEVLSTYKRVSSIPEPQVQSHND